MEPLKRLPDSELEVMKIFWQQETPLTRPQLQRLLAHKNWTTPTFQALLARLEKKGFLCHEMQGNTFLYRVLIGLQQYLPVESSSALNRLFEGRPVRLVAALHQTDALSDADIDELYAYLAQLRGARG